MEDLFKKGFLKSYKFPFFIFKDNRNKGALIQSYEEKQKCLKKINNEIIYNKLNEVNSRSE